MRFDNRVFLVTGGARGIGRAITKRLAEDGARVCVFDPDGGAAKDAVEEYGADHVLAVRGSVAKEPDVRRAVAATVKWAGRLNGVVNNAGIAAPEVGPVEDLALAKWNKYLGVNLTGAFLVVKHAIPWLRKAATAEVPSTVVNIGSTRSQQSEPQTIAYSATKGGIASLTHALAVTLGPAVRVNCVEPGWVATSTFAPRGERKAPKLSAEDHHQHPAGRVGRPEDIASLVGWLSSAEAGFVTGATYVSDGGMTKKMIYV